MTSVRARRLIASMLVAVCLLLAGAAQATPIGTPVQIGVNKVENATTTSLVFTTNVNINAGDFVGCSITFASGGGTISTAVDSGAVNTWTRVTVSNSAPTEFFIYTSNATALASGGTITAGYSSTGGKKAMACASVSGIAAASPRDATAAATSNSATATSATTINSGALAAPNELLIAGINSTSGTDFGTFTPPAGWTLLLTSTSANGAFRVCYLITTTPASQPWSPAWGTSTLFRSWAFMAFKGATTDGGPLLGVQ